MKTMQELYHSMPSWPAYDNDNDNEPPVRRPGADAIRRQEAY